MILVALDGSQREPEVFRAATAIAQRFGAALHVCRAITIPVGMPDELWAVPLVELDAALVADANRAIAVRVADSPVAIAGAHVRVGLAADVVLDVAKEIGAELIVIGAHGYGVFERLLGTTASKIVHRATCSVMVARPHEVSSR